MINYEKGGSFMEKKPEVKKPVTPVKPEVKATPKPVKK